MKNKFAILLVTIMALIFAPPVLAQASLGSLKTVATSADLPYVAAGTGYGSHAMVSGWAAANDGGWGIYCWSASSALSTNYAVIASLRPEQTGGQWLRLPGGGQASPRTQTLTAASNIVCEAHTVRVAGTGGATSLTSTPTISTNGIINGQELTIEGTSDTNTVVLSDDGTVAGSKLELAASTRTLGVGDTLVIKYNSTTAKWYEKSFANP
jgi:hypothetical protein